MRRHVIATVRRLDGGDDGNAAGAGVPRKPLPNSGSDAIALEPEQDPVEQESPAGPEHDAPRETDE
jgi:hypothetical protein